MDLLYIGPLDKEKEPERKRQSLAELMAKEGRKPSGFELTLGGEPMLQGVPEEWRNPAHPNFQPSIFAAPERQIDITPLGGIKSVGQRVISALKVPRALPKRAASVGLKAQKIPEEFKALEVEAAKRIKKAPTLTHEALDSMSNAILTSRRATTKVIKKLQAGDPLTVVESDAARKVHVAGMDRFFKELANTKTYEEADKLLDKYADGLFEPVSSHHRFGGQLLESFKKEVSLNRLTRDLAKMAKHKGMGPKQWDLLRGLDYTNAAQVEDVINKLPDPKLRDYFYEFWYNCILAGPPTHLVNVASNTVWGSAQIPHRALTAGADKVWTMFTGKQRTRFLSESIAMMGGMKTGFKTGRKAAWELTKTGKVQQFETKWAREMSYAMGSWDRSPYPWMREVGKYMTVPTKALRAMDVWANSMAYDMQARALARRASKIKGLKGEARNLFERNWLKNMSKSDHEACMEFARYSTFTDDPGRLANKIIGARDVVPGGRLVIPFVRTISNLLRRGTEMVPGVGLFLTRKQGAAEAIAKQIEGLIIGALVMSKVRDEEITFSAPTTPAERDMFYMLGKRAWSIKIGDNWVQWRRMEPWNTVIAATGLAWDKYMHADDDETRLEAMLDVVDQFKNNLIDSSYMQGVTQILSREGKFKGFVERTVAGFVPFSSFWRSISRAYEAYTEGSAKVRDVEGWLGAFTQTIPGLSKEMPARINIWGEEVELPGGPFRQWLPWRWSKASTDEVELELDRLGYYPGLPKQKVKIRGNDVELPLELYRDYLLITGKKAKKRMDEIVSRPSYKRWPDKKKMSFLKREFNRIRNRERKRVKALYMRNTRTAPTQSNNLIYLGE